MHSGRWQPQYIQLEGVKGSFHPQTLGGGCMGVFEIWAATLTVRLLEGAKGRSCPQIWGGCCRVVVAICLMELRVPLWEGSKGRPRPQLWGGCCRGAFAICLVTLTFPQLGGAKGLLALNMGGDAVGAFLHSGWWQPQYAYLEGAKGRFRPQNWGGCCSGDTHGTRIGRSEGAPPPSNLGGMMWRCDCNLS